MNTQATKNFVIISVNHVIVHNYKAKSSNTSRGANGDHHQKTLKDYGDSGIADCRN